MMTQRWRNRPEGANWGVFGVDDELGRLNLLTPARRLAAMREVRTGEAFCLSLPLDLPGGNLLVKERHPPARGVEIRDGGLPFVNYPMAVKNPRWTDVSSDDWVKLYTQYSTQWDAFCHLGRAFDADGDGIAEPCYYNGFRGGVDVLGPDDPGGPVARRLGIEKMAETCVQGRGVLLDLHRHFGPARRLVGLADLQRVMAADGVAVEEGDMVCLHTGYGQAILDMKGRPDPEMLHNSHCVLDGRDPALLDWIDRSGLAVLIADNFAVEGFPYAERDEPGCHAGLPLHQKCLFELGIHLGELWYLTELARRLGAERRGRFLLTAPPLRLPGSFGSPATPVATI
jgi:hypothetical protein